MSKFYEEKDVYNARNVLLDVLEGRGFDVAEYNNYDLLQVKAMIDSNQLDLLLRDAKGKKIFVKFNLDTKPVPANLADDFFADILTPSDDLLIVAKDDPNDTITESLEHLWASRGVFITIISLKRLQYNILKHDLVPKHVVLTAEQAAEELKPYTDNMSHLPEIGRFDPVATLLGIRPGMICRIDRGSKTAMTAVYYRACV